MIIVAGTVTFDPVPTEALVAAVHTVSEATRSENGCISYEFFADLTRPGRLHLLEQWEEERHLSPHFETRHLADFYQQPPAAGPASRVITRYQVSSHGPNQDGGKVQAE